MNAKGRAKEDGASRVFSKRHDISRTTQDARRTTHDPLPTHPCQLVNATPMFPLALNHLLDVHMLRVFYSLGGSHNRVYHLEQDEAIYL